MLQNKRIIYFAEVAWYHSAIYIGTKGETYATATHGAGYKHKLYKTLDAAVRFCQRKQEPSPPADKHIEIHDLHNGTQETLREYLSLKMVRIAPWLIGVASCKQEDAFIKAVTEHKDELTEKDEFDNTVFHFAARKGFVRALKFLSLHVGALINAINFARETPLHLAALHLKVSVIEYLLSQKVDVLTRSNHEAPPNLKQQSALRYLDHMARRHPEPASIIFPLTFKFMVTEHAGLKVFLASDEKDNYKINRVEIDKTKYAKGFVRYWEPEYKAYFDGNKIKSGYEIRHKRSVASILALQTQKWRNVPVSTLPEKDRMDFLSVCDYIKQEIRGILDSKENLFIGSAVENQAFGWLASVLALRKRDIIRCVKGASLCVQIPEKYRAVFSTHKSYEALTSEQYNRGLNTFNFSRLNMGRFYKLAHNDNPEFADTAPPPLEVSDEPAKKRLKVKA